MNPLEFSWKEDQQVTVTNPTAETYKFRVHSKEYELGAGKSAKMPGYIAWVYVYGLASKMCQADGNFNRWNEEGYRQEYYEKLVAGVDALVQDVQIEEKPLVQHLDDGTDEEEADDESDLPDIDDEEATAVPAGVAPMKPKAKASDKPAKSA